MDRRDCAIVVNSCEKYAWILEPMFGLLRRYAPDLEWPVYFATEKYDDFQIQRICKTYNVQILKLAEEDADFLESRVAAVKMLPPEIKYVLPLQEDFLLERPGPNGAALKEALRLFDTDPDVLSMRLMPCPGPAGLTAWTGNWHRLMGGEMLFTYQATLWRREVYETYLRRIIHHGREQHPELKGRAWNQYCIGVNPAETYLGQSLLMAMYPQGVHLCWARAGFFANAVYLCPWPYRPTAIVKGILQPWAEELIHREGFKTRPSLR
jgi:hypothetical protein